MEKVLEPIDKEQRIKAAEDLNNTFLIEAGAGTGKTKLLLNRLINIILSGAPLNQIAAITFSKAHEHNTANVLSTEESAQAQTQVRVHTH